MGAVDMFEGMRTKYGAPRPEPSLCRIESGPGESRIAVDGRRCMKTAMSIRVRLKKTSMFRATLTLRQPRILIFRTTEVCIVHFVYPALGSLFVSLYL